MPSTTVSNELDLDDMLWSFREFACAKVGDRRRIRSLSLIVYSLCNQAGISLTAALGNGLRQAAHRIFEHGTVSVLGLMQGHVQETVKRLSSLKTATGVGDLGADLVLVSQDTTSFDYSTQYCLEGAGPITTAPKSQGLMSHCALAMTTTGLPLGIVHLAVWARDKANVGSRNLRKQRETHEKESQKWIDGLRAIEAAYPEDQPLLIIQDREGDVFNFLNVARRPTTYLLVRAAQGRSVLTEKGVEGTLFNTVANSAVIGQYTAIIPRKPGQKEQEADFDLRVQQLTIRNPKAHKDYSNPVWVVQATQSNALEGEEPLEWILLCTMPVGSAEQAKKIVEYYTRRWMVERLHYTLKSGCKVERLQIDDIESLKKALAIYYIVAWRLLFMTYLSRNEPQMPASCALSADEIIVLSASQKRKITTIEAAVKAICKLGGYEPYAKAKDPGVKSFWTGIRKLESMVEGWKLAIEMQNVRYDS